MKGFNYFIRCFSFLIYHDTIKPALNRTLVCFLTPHQSTIAGIKYSREIFICVDKPDGCSQACSCMLCLNDSLNQDLLTCSVCMDCYHCITSHAAYNMCPYCHIIEKLMQLCKTS